MKIIAYLFLCSTRVRHLVLRLCPKTKLTDVKFLVLQECVVATMARHDQIIYSNDLLGVTVSFDSYKIKVWCEQAALNLFIDFMESYRVSRKKVSGHWKAPRGPELTSCCRLNEMNIPSWCSTGRIWKIRSLSIFDLQLRNCGLYTV